MNKAANGGGKKRFSRLLCLALVFLMLCSLAPVGAWAADDAGVPEDSVGAGSDSALNEPEPPAEEEPPAPTEEEPSAPTEEEPPAPTEEEPPAPTEEEPPAPAEEDPPAPAEDPAEDPKDELPPDNGETPTGDNLLPIEEAEEKGEDEEA